MRVTSTPAPALRPRAAVEPVSAASLRERHDRRRQTRREPIVVHVPVPLGPSGVPSAVRDAYRCACEHHAVDVYL
jgi:hypothetical protein